MTNGKKGRRPKHDYMRKVEIIEGERGPATLDDSFLAPGRPEFDRISNFSEIYRANSETGAGPTENYFDQYAWVESGEVARKSAELDYSARGSYHTIMARAIADGLLAGDDVNMIRASLRAQFVEPGLVVNWAIVRVKVVDMLADNTKGLVVTDANTYEHNVLEEALYHMEQEGLNNFHGWEGPLPYEHVHVVAGKREGFVPTSFCGLSMQGNSDGAPEGHPVEEFKQPLWITWARYDRFGMPPFCPPCFECLEAMSQRPTRDEEIDADALVKAQIAGECICAQMRKITALSTFEAPERSGPEDPIPAWICPVDGEVWASEGQRGAYSAARTGYEERLMWYKHLAMGLDEIHSPLPEKEAGEWAAKMVSAELVVQYPREAGRFKVEYDDLIGVATAEDTQTGAAAALDSEMVDAWARCLPGQENVEARSRVLLALVTDKLLNNPDTGDSTARVVEAPAEDLSEGERIKLARLRIEQGLLAELRERLETENEFAYEAHWSESGDVVLLLVDYGRWLSERALDEERVLGYVLALVSPFTSIAEVIEEGGRFAPALSHRDDPFGIGSADDVMALILGNNDFTAFKRPLSAEEHKRVADFAETISVKERADDGDNREDNLAFDE